MKNELKLKSSPVASLKVHDVNYATVKARLLTVRNQKVGYISIDEDGNEEIKYATLDKAFCERLLANYKKVTKRKFGIGKINSLPISVEHEFIPSNIVGSMSKPIEEVSCVIDGKPCIAYEVEISITDPYVVSDLRTKGRDSEFSCVSIGADLSEPKDPKLYEVTLCKEGRLEEALLLSKGLPMQKLEEGVREYEKILAREEDERKEKLKLKAMSMLENHFSQNRIDKRQANLLLSKLENNLNEEAINAVNSSLEILPKNKLLLASTLIVS